VCAGACAGASPSSLTQREGDREERERESWGVDIAATREASIALNQDSWRKRHGRSCTHTASHGANVVLRSRGLHVIYISPTRERRVSTPALNRPTQRLHRRHPHTRAESDGDDNDNDDVRCSCVAETVVLQPFATVEPPRCGRESREQRVGGSLHRGTKRARWPRLVVAWRARECATDQPTDRSKQATSVRKGERTRRRRGESARERECAPPVADAGSRASERASMRGAVQ